jgi:hypothetical protein
MEKSLSDITRKEWVALRWIEIGALGEERLFMSDGKRTPDEALKAMEEWDMTAEERGQEGDEYNESMCKQCCSLYSDRNPPCPPPCDTCGGWVARQVMAQEGTPCDEK